MILPGGRRVAEKCRYNLPFRCTIHTSVRSIHGRGLFFHLFIGCLFVGCLFCDKRCAAGSWFLDTPGTSEPFRWAPFDPGQQQSSNLCSIKATTQTLLVTSHFCFSWAMWTFPLLRKSNSLNIILMSPGIWREVVKAPTWGHLAARNKIRALHAEYTLESW